MADEEKKAPMNALEIDRFADANIFQKNEDTSRLEESDPILFSKSLMVDNYYIVRETVELPQQSNSSAKRSIDTGDLMEGMIKLFLERGFTDKEIGEIVTRVYGNGSMRRSSMPKKLFIASSSEGLDHAAILQRHLTQQFKMHSLDITCVLWHDDGVFRNGESTLANLERIANELYAEGDKKRMGYAVCVLTPDEIVTMRDEEYSIARDNVLFEYGLFLGKLGHARTFLVNPPKDLGDDLPKFHTLSDLNGITSMEYQSYTRGASYIQVETALYQVAFRIFGDIFEMEKELLPSERDSSSGAPTLSNNSQSKSTPKIGDHVLDGTGRLTKY